MAYIDVIGASKRRIYARLAFPLLSLDKEYIQSIELNSDIITGDKFEIGTAISDNVKVTLIDKDNFFPTYDFTSKEFTVEFGILDSDDVTVLWHTMGYFTVEEAVRKDITVSIKATDRMYKSDIEYANTLVYPQTLGAILQDVCTHAGLTLATTVFANSTVEVATEPSFYKVTDRKIIASIAELAGGYAKMNGSGQLEIITLSATSPKVVTRANFTSMSRDEAATATIDKVIVQVGEVQAVQGSGSSPYTVLNNMFVQTPSLFVGALFGVLNGLSFTPLQMRWQGDWALPHGQYVQVDDDGESFYMFEHRRAFAYNGGMIQISRSIAKSNVVKNSASNGSLTVRVEQSEAKISVLESEIVLKVSQTDFDSLGNEVSAAQSSISILEDEVATKVSTTDLEQQLTNYATIQVVDDKVGIAVGTINETLDEYGNVIGDVQTNFIFDEVGMTIGKTNDPFKVVITNAEFDIMNGGVAVAYINGTTMSIENIIALQKIKMGVHQLFRYASTDYTLITWIGG